ncbi:HAMP domain-containing sensor histidine kinase [Sphaerisporangium sp. NPDC005289]|uniref:sensor histidine kinase n=1 Tax=Sphaerisporangium sp. NPDC005289 TaxID=3155247 RepID=UPI0033B14E3A
MRPLHQWPITTRLTLLAGVAAAVLCVLSATVLMVAIHRLATQYLTEEVAAATERVVYQVERHELHNPIAHSQIRDIQVVDPQGRIAAASRELQGAPRIATFVPEGARNMATQIICDRGLARDGCDIVVAQEAYRDGKDMIVYSAAPAVPPLVHSELAMTMAGGVVVFTTLITYGTYRTVRGSLQPVDAIRAELDEINAMSLDRRVPSPPQRDQIRDLADSVNHTLERLQEALERQRRFASDVSHDLRSPVTAMRVQVEEAMMGPEEGIDEVTGKNLLGNLDRLQAIIADLLVLARLDAATQGARDLVDLAELVLGEVRARHPSAIRIDCDLRPGVVVLGDRLRLTRLLSNLLTNAERHAESTITVTVARSGGGPGSQGGEATLSVVDDGAGIPAGSRESVFQRFVRLSEGRRRDPGGTGLGLPIARQIAEMSGGTLTIEDSPRGARLVLRLPAAAPPR